MFEILHQLEIAGSRAAVFQAMTTPSGLDSWWTRESEGIPRLGQEYRFFFGPEYDWRAVVVEVVDGSALTWKMTQAMDDWKPTSFGFGLFDRGHRTVMKFFHRNWPHDGEHFAISNYCWGQLLHGMKLYVERGHVIPFDRRNEG